MALYEELEALLTQILSLTVFCTPLRRPMTVKPPEWGGGFSKHFWVGVCLCDSESLALKPGQVQLHLATFD